MIANIVCGFRYFLQDLKSSLGKFYSYKLFPCLPNGEQICSARDNKKEICDSKILKTLRIAYLLLKSGNETLPRFCGFKKKKREEVSTL